MLNIKKPLIPITICIVVISCIIGVSCKFSFAENKTPVIGAEKPPVIRSSPQLDQFKNVFADVAEQVIPTVVSITSTKIDTVVYRDPFSQFFYGNPFDEFFGGPRQQRRGQQPPEQKEEQRQSVGGSGVIVSSDGYIITNYHVVGNANEIIVKTYDKREFEAKVVGSDSLSDVAVIKITEKVSDLKVAYLGNSDSLRPADWVLAIGNPLSLSSTVTLGIVSALNRNTQGTMMYQNYIQTDAAINPGNSGGALINIKGELIGINTMIMTNTGGYMGVGFAIPINMARNIMEQILKNGKVTRGLLGVLISDIDNNMMEALELKSTKGALVNDVVPDGAAQKAGIKKGDVILSVNGTVVQDGNSLKNLIASITPGSKASVEIIRNGKSQTVQVVIGSLEKTNFAKAEEVGKEKENPEDTKDVDLTKKVGFKVGAITDNLREKLNLKASLQGVVVLSVEQNSSAARKGLMVNDIIRLVKVQRGEFTEVANVAEFKKIINQVKTNESIIVQVIRSGGPRGENSLYIAFKSN